MIDEPEGGEDGEPREEEEGKRRKKKGEKVSHEVCHFVLSVLNEFQIHHL